MPPSQVVVGLDTSIHVQLEALPSVPTIHPFVQDRAEEPGEDHRLVGAILSNVHRSPEHAQERYERSYPVRQEQAVRRIFVCGERVDAFRRGVLQKGRLFRVIEKEYLAREETQREVLSVLFQRHCHVLPPSVI